MKHILDLKRHAERIQHEMLNNSSDESFRKWQIYATALAVVIVAAGAVYWNMYRTTNDPSVVLGTNFPDIYTSPLLIKLSDLSISILPLDAQPARAEVVDNAVRYIDAYPNTDVVQTKSFNKIKEDIILKQPGHPGTFRYQIDVAKYDFKKDLNGNFIFYEKGHKDDNNFWRFSIPAPFMADYAGKVSSTLDVESTIDDNGLLTIKPSAEWLAQAQYPVALDPTVEINVVSVHSHPQQGDNWVVDFTTRGTADLKIIPNDQATVDDDEFVSLSCNGEQRTPQILPGDIIFYPNWSCLPSEASAKEGDGTGQVVHYTKKTGNHTLRFEFGGQVSYAYNTSGGSPIIFRAGSTSGSTFSATGGTITYTDSDGLNPRSSPAYAGGYTVHTFTSDGTFTVTGSGNVDALVVAGGGSGGSSSSGGGAGGGGAGGYINSSIAVTAQAYTVTVGGGGQGVAGTGQGNNGANSVFSTITATGGGYGGGGDGNAGHAGGSGGGGAGQNGTGGAASPAGQGNAGGAGKSGDPPTGGGGGASQAGSDGVAPGPSGKGGDGTANSISGASVTYAGGGGGGSRDDVSQPGAGGAGGGGAGATTGSGTAGTANRGGGGGGAGRDGSAGGNGGSGVVIIRYIPTEAVAAVNYPTIFRAGGYVANSLSATGGTITYTDSNGQNPRSSPAYAGGYTIHTFTGNGTFTVTGSGTVDVLVVGGGGRGGDGGNTRGGGGGGAGGYRYSTSHAVTAQAYSVTVGAASAGEGNPSIFDTITAAGGGRGGNQASAGSSGGSGGGSGGGSDTDGGAGNTPSVSPSQGNNGGSSDTNARGGGGGGASAAGATAASGNPVGGNGTANSISGTSVTYAGGGGGAGNNEGAAGGTGGGGAGAAGGGDNGTANTGGGGGAGGWDGDQGNSGGSGGSGIVIVRYRTSTFSATVPTIFRITRTAPANTVVPTVSGTAQVGQTLTCSTGTWTGSPTISYSYQWQHTTTNISGATNSTYVVEAAYVGETLRCVVTASNLAGNASANSANTAVVEAAAQNGNFDGVKMLYNHEHTDPVRATIQWSTDDSNWNTVGTLGDWASGEQSEKSTTFTAPGRKRYWRMTFTDPNDGNIGGQSDVILEVTWRQNTTYVTDKSGVTITGSGIGGTLNNTYDGSDASGTTSISEGAILKFDFGA